MKKLLVLALVANVAMAENSFMADMKDLGSDIGSQIVLPLKDVAETVKDSEIGQDGIELGQQLAGTPEIVKDGYTAAVDATKNFGRKIADSRFVAKVKDANQAIVDASKKAATKAKDVANDIIHSEAVEDTKDVLGQFADAPRETWDNFAAFFTAIKSEFID